MRLNSATAHLEATGITERKGFSIDFESSKIFDILQDTMYTDKPLAPVREYLCNALDAHKMTGQQRPFDVYVPNNNVPEWVVRDYGPGLSHDDMMELYTTYLRSTKDNANDLIGGFGLGSKSGFAYTDQFTVISYFNGVRTRYAVFKNEKRKPDIAVVDRVDTDEPNGLEVRVPVSAADFAAFADRTRAVLKYFPEGSYNAFDLPVTHPKYIIQEPTHAFARPGGVVPPKVVMGNVCYPLPPATWQKHPLLVDAYNQGFDLTLFANIGDCSLSPSREALSADRATEAWINAAITKIFSELEAKIKAQLDSAANFYEYADVATTQNGLLKSVVPPQKLSPYADMYFDNTSGNRRYQLSVEALERAGLSVYLTRGEQGGPPRRVRTATTHRIPSATLIALAPKDKLIARMASAQPTVYKEYHAKPNKERLSYDAGPYLIVSDAETLKKLGLKAHIDLNDFKPNPSLVSSKGSTRDGYMVWQGVQSRRRRDTKFDHEVNYIMIEDGADENWLHTLKWHLQRRHHPSTPTPHYFYPEIVYVPATEHATFKKLVTKGYTRTLAEHNTAIVAQLKKDISYLAGMLHPSSISKSVLEDFFKVSLPPAFYEGQGNASNGKDYMRRLVDASSPIKDEVLAIMKEAEQYHTTAIQPKLAPVSDILADNPKLAHLLTTVSPAHYPYIRTLWENQKP